MVTVIFPAAGQGKRMKARQNKIFLQLCHTSILELTVRKFSACDVIDDMIIVAAPEEVDFLTAELQKIHGLKPFQVVPGGSERQYSIANGLKALPAEAHIVLVHDMARPLVTEKVINQVVQQADKYGAAIAAVPEKNTIKVVGEDLTVQSTPDRAFLWAVQTPQGFRKDILLQAYQKALDDNFLGTDDASLVERLGVAVKVVTSTYSNIKITTPEDIFVAEALLQAQRMETGEIG